MIFIHTGYKCGSPGYSHFPAGIEIISAEPGPGNTILATSEKQIKLPASAESFIIYIRISAMGKY